MVGSHTTRIRYYRHGANIHEENREIPTDPRLFKLPEHTPWTEDTRPDYAVIDYPAFGTAVFYPFVPEPGQETIGIRDARPEDTPNG